MRLGSKTEALQAITALHQSQTMPVSWEGREGGRDGGGGREVGVGGMGGGGGGGGR